MDEKKKENRGISLLKKGQKGLSAVIFSRLGLIILLLAVQVLVLFAAFYWFSEFLPHIWGAALVFTLFMVFYLLNIRMDNSAKITWLIIIMFLPIFGSLLLLFTRREIGHRGLRKRYAVAVEQTRDAVPQKPEAAEGLKNADPGSASLAVYMNRSGCAPIYDNTDVTYFPSGEASFDTMLSELDKAEHFIFLEYFIVSEGLMWGRILEILAKKAAAGVEIRMMYDGTNEFSTLPHDYPQRLQKLGIQCKMFAPARPFVSTHYNYRDHRKIMVIDGQTAFTGGINLADEYINETHRYGYWKDTCLMVQGEAVSSFTLMFLQMWAMDEKEPQIDRSFLNIPVPDRKSTPGFVIPYGDCPLDDDKVGEQVYIDILNRAQRYVHIMTPYMILDGELENALKFAAERGVEVVLILPGQNDSYISQALAYTHYASLLASGVKIYEYTPGFVHAKIFVSDDRIAVIGTINMDYRSLYHHFECGTYLYGTECNREIEADFVRTRAQCREITKENVKDEKFTRKITGFLMKPIGTLL